MDENIILRVCAITPILHLPAFARLRDSIYQNELGLVVFFPLFLSAMWLSTILLNPHVRVYNLRCLLVGAVLLVALGAVIDVYGWDGYQASSHLDAVPIATGCLMIVHHIFALCMCSRHTAVLDLVLSIVEIICEVTIRGQTLTILRHLCSPGLLDLLVWAVTDTAYCVDGGGNYLPGVYDPGISRPSLATKIRVSWRMPRCKSAVYGMENCAESLASETSCKGRVHRYPYSARADN
ncbi:hypothetical protein DFH06DRAFT_347487 [Mycena polygramma]|nr:hypothetical protein DFH06DRAFT_347487 [Mycena polygramma]